jgi:SAM-dependent methyltransferase
MARVRPYYAEGGLSAAFYDVVTAADRNLAGDVDIYAGLAAPGAEVLELGVGSGRIAFALAGRGYRVTGVDIAPAMLAQAQARLRSAPSAVAERLRFLRGDMTALDLKRTFDLVICPYFVLAHVPAGAAWRNVFGVIARHLAVGRLCAVHLPLVELMRRPAPDPRRTVLDEPLPTGGRLQLHVLERRFREDIGRLDQLVDYVERDAQGRIVRRSPERLRFYIADPRPFAEAAGVVLDRQPEQLGKAGQMWVFRKPGGERPASTDHAGEFDALAQGERA